MTQMDGLAEVVQASSSGSDTPAIVLVVDDHEDTLALYETVLSTHGYWVAKAASAVEGLECARVLRPDVIIVDVRLHGDQDGTDLVRALRADARLRTVPILMVTGCNPRVLPSIAGLHISGMLMKPLAPVTLVARVEQLLEASQRLCRETIGRSSDRHEPPPNSNP
jgi:two-component system, OmpR family, response regulator